MLLPACWAHSCQCPRHLPWGCRVLSKPPRKQEAGLHQHTLMTAVCWSLLGYPRRHQALQEAGLLTSAFVPGPSTPHRLRRSALVVERAIGEPAGKALRQLPGALRPALGFRGGCFPFASPAPKAPPGPVGPGFLVFPRPSRRNCRLSEQKAYYRPYWKPPRSPRALS